MSKVHGSIRETWYRLSGLTIGLLAMGFSIALLVFGYFSIERMRAVDSMWQNYSSGEQLYASELSKLTLQIGYGGLIHHFKNYVLRGQKSYEKNLEKCFSALFSSLDRLNELASTDAERAEIRAVRATFSEYRNKFELAKKMVGKGDTPYQIDREVKVDDAAALKALNLLIHNSLERGHKQEAHVSSFMNETLSTFKFGGLITIPLFLLSMLLVGLIHKRTLAIQKLCKRGDQLASIVDASPDPMFFVNDQGVIECSNVATENMFGYTEAELKQITIEELIPERFRHGHEKMRKRFFEAPSSRSFGKGMKLFALKKDGSEIPVEISLNHSVYDGKVTVSVAMIDISERVKAQEALLEANNKLELLASTDGLTRVYNRRAFMQMGLAELQRSERYGQTPAFLFVDLDHFKGVNDHYGHHTGDQALIMVVDVMKKILREVDMIGRLGGDEFSVILPSTRESDAMQIAERICKQVALTPIPDTEDAYITVSVGVTVAPEKELSVERVMSCADEAMYAAKSGGKNRVVHLPCD